jgi:DNA-directed RNA polymerase subunit RPC12/RpoP
MSACAGCAASAVVLVVNGVERMLPAIKEIEGLSGTRCRACGERRVVRGGRVIVIPALVLPEMPLAHS